MLNCTLCVCVCVLDRVYIYRYISDLLVPFKVVNGHYLHLSKSRICIRSS